MRLNLDGAAKSTDAYSLQQPFYLERLPTDHNWLGEHHARSKAAQP
jgi:hypothetical protein